MIKSKIEIEETCHNEKYMSDPAERIHTKLNQRRRGFTNTLRQHWS